MLGSALLTAGTVDSSKRVEIPADRYLDWPTVYRSSVLVSSPKGILALIRLGSRFPLRDHGR
jgi:hypothetical protein